MTTENGGEIPEVTKFLRKGYDLDDVVQVVSEGLTDKEMLFYREFLRERGVLVEGYQGKITRHLTKLRRHYLDKYSQYVSPRVIEKIFSSLPASRVWSIALDSLPEVIRDWHNSSKEKTVAMTDQYSNPEEQIVKAMTIESLKALNRTGHLSPVISINFVWAAQMGDLRIKELGWPSILAGHLKTNHEDDFVFRKPDIKGVQMAGTDTIKRIIFLGVPRGMGNSYDIAPALDEEIAHYFLAKTGYALIGSGFAVNQKDSVEKPI